MEKGEAEGFRVEVVKGAERLNSQGFLYPPGCGLGTASEPLFGGVGTIKTTCLGGLPSEQGKVEDLEGVIPLINAANLLL